ncbi:MAG: hypothetical protein M1819_002076 [Sarea resinae]|nr:MAG: hypothetical protein M1819_002076 [Sarea resinae]
MAPSDDKEAMAKQRIISHMNGGHQESLVRFLEYQFNLPYLAVRNAVLVDMTFNALLIAPKKDSVPYSVPFNPPLNSWAEARERIVKLDQETLAGLGRSNITVREYRLPQSPLHVTVLTLCLLTFGTLWRRQNVAPGSLLYDAGLNRYPAFADWLYTVAPWVFNSMVVIHVLEAIYMARTRLAVHNVRIFSRLWWTWTVSTFLEGFGAFQRFGAIVTEQKIERESQKH